jgi:hypothetical protein
VKVSTERAEKTRNWEIPEKFINNDFADYISNTNVLEENGIVRDTRPIKGCYGSMQEWADHFQLMELHEIDLDSILKLLEDKGCVKIDEKNNVLQYYHQNMAYLEAEIRARIKR